MDYEKLNELIQQHLSAELPKFAKVNSLIQRRLVQVAEVDDDTASVYIPPDFEIKSVFYKNKSGATLTVGDWVYIDYPFGRIDQGWIIDKK